MKMNLHAAVAALSLASWIQQASAQALAPERPGIGKQTSRCNRSRRAHGELQVRFRSVGTFRDMAPLDVPQTSNVITREVLDAQGLPAYSVHCAIPRASRAHN